MASTAKGTKKAHDAGHELAHRKEHGEWHESAHNGKHELGPQTRWFHGSEREIERFTLDFLSSGAGHDQEGPGLYFTTDPKDAKMYGEFVHEVRLNLRKTVPLVGQVSPATVRALIQASPDCDDHLEDWAENRGKALRDAVAGILFQQGEPQQIFQQIWYDFYRGCPDAYLREMVKLGFDGVVADRTCPPDWEPRFHIIVFDPSAVTMVETTDHNQIPEEACPRRLRSIQAMNAIMPGGTF